MFLPFEVGEIHGILDIVYKIISVGWNPANNASMGSEHYTPHRFFTSC
jgi:hypothetical protein